MTINDWAWHVFQCDLPFGGSGNSGIGSWRGPEGFRALVPAAYALISGLVLVAAFSLPAGPLGLGLIVVGAFFAAAHGGSSLTIAPMVSVVSALLFVGASRYYERDVAAIGNGTRCNAVGCA